jgi:predicted nucleic acid-binding protein
VVAGDLIYLDSSALVKLSIPEAESEALFAFVSAHRRRATSVVARVEVPRARIRLGAGSEARQALVLADMTYLELSDEVIERAATLEPATLRSLDAIHIASALELVPELHTFVTYDARQAAAARASGLSVVAPA